MGFRRRLNPLSDLLILACVFLFARFTYGKSNATKAAAITPVNHDLYHTRYSFASLSTFFLKESSVCVI